MGVDVSDESSPSDKSRMLSCAPLLEVPQRDQLDNPNAAVSLTSSTSTGRLAHYAIGIHGLTTGDLPRMRREFWEFPFPFAGWIRFQGAFDETMPYGGRDGMLFWNGGRGPIAELPGARRDGLPAWGKHGVAVRQMGQLPCTLFTGEAFDNTVAVILPRNDTDLPAIWAFCSSDDFHGYVRQVNQKLNVDVGYFGSVPFELDYWQKIADETGPLPEPYSNDPTQWLFKGVPVGSTEPLQVAVARLIGYRWPDQELDRLDVHADEDGVVCLPPVAGEQPAAERLRALLATGYADAWSPAKQDQLLAQVGDGGKDLQEWLRDGFFLQHCKRFHNRPFIWHIWDGRRDGFSALVIYHKLDAAGLNRLIYTYLGSWIETQRAAHSAGEAGADGRLVAALELQRKLQLIAEGEPPYDIYVRWKPLHEQPIGWNPELNDGVRLNVRPFVAAGVLRSKFTISWNKDRGSDPDGRERLNDLHLTIAEKRAARQAAGVR